MITWDIRQGCVTSPKIACRSPFVSFTNTVPRMAIGDRMSRFHATERLCLTLWLKAFLFLFNVRRVAKSISLIEITVKCFASLVEKYYG